MGGRKEHVCIYLVSFHYNTNKDLLDPTTQHKHHDTITHLVLVLHQLELFYGKQQRSIKNEMRDIE
jgi:hypothetical protein